METEAGIYFLNILSAGVSLSWRYPLDPCKLSVFSVSRCLYLSHFAPHNVSSVSRDKTGLRSPQLSTLFKQFVLFRFRNYLISWFSYNFRLFLPKLLSLHSLSHEPWLWIILTIILLHFGLTQSPPPPPEPGTSRREAERGVSPGTALFRYLLYIYS